MVMQGNAALFFADGFISRMIAALCTQNPPPIAAADGDDPAMTAQAIAFCRERGLPLILCASQPQTIGIPPDIRGRILPRPFLFADFSAALWALTGMEPTADAAQENNEVREEPPLVWDSERRAVICGGSEVILTPREADVFAALYAASPAAVSREQLQKEFSRTAGNGADVYVSYLRRKLTALPLTVRIHSERGRGYTLLIQPGISENAGITTDYSSGDK